MPPAPPKENKDDFRKMSGPQKAAMFLMAIGEENATKLFTLMDDEEIREISSIMSNLGQVNADAVERLFHEFAEQVSSELCLLFQLLFHLTLLPRAPFLCAPYTRGCISLELTGHVVLLI